MKDLNWLFDPEAESFVAQKLLSGVEGGPLGSVS